MSTGHRKHLPRVLDSPISVDTSGERPQADTITELQQKTRELEAEIAARERVEAELAEALERERTARELAQLALGIRDEFLVVAAHELKTPLTSVLGYSQILNRRIEEEELDRERLSLPVQRVIHEATKLSYLVDQLLDVSRLETGHVELEPRPVDLAAIVEDVVAGVQTWNIRHTITTAHPERLTANVDPMRFEQMLVNLLDNALHHTPEGGAIEVSLRCLGAEGTREAAVVELAVRDHGAGIEDAHRAQIFDRFYRVAPGSPRRGLGLGLYVTREIARLHGGEVTAEFPEDGGTCFLVRLPALPNEE